MGPHPVIDHFWPEAHPVSTEFTCHAGVMSDHNGGDAASREFGYDGGDNGSCLHLICRGQWFVHEEESTSGEACDGSRKAGQLALEPPLA